MPDPAKHHTQFPPSRPSDDAATVDPTVPPGEDTPRDLPERVGRFLIRGFLGGGSFGVVYRAYDPQLEREVALKLMRGASPSEERVRRFRREAKAAAGLRHPHIVPLFEAGEADGQFYLASMFVPGMTLEDAIKERGADERLSPAEAAAIAQKLADALAYAHRQGVIHRDVKSSNVILDPQGDPHLLDFGLARRSEDHDRLTVAGSVLGTAAYLAPEAARGDKSRWTPAADQYALGIVLYELLSGNTPFAGPVELVLALHQTQDPDRPSRHNPEVPRDLDAVCLKCLEKDPARRYTSAEELSEDLRRFLAGQPVRARRPGPGERLGRWCRRNPAVAALSLLLGLTLVGGLSAATALWLRAEDNRSLAEERRGQAESNLATAEQQRKQAERNRVLAEEQRGKAEANLATAEQQRKQAEANFEIALEAVERMLYQVGATKLANVPQMESVRGELLEEAEKFFQQLLAQKTTNPQLRQRTGKAHWALADFCQQCRRNARAEEAYRQAITIFEMLVADFPESTEYLRNLASANSNLSVLYTDRLGRHADAEGLIRNAFRTREQLLAKQPDNADYRHDMGFSHLVLANWLRKEQRYREAETGYLKAIELQSGLAAQFPDYKSYKQEWARGHHAMGWMFVNENRPVEAEKAFRESLNIREELTKRFPKNAELRDNLARNIGSLAKILYDQKRYDPAIKEYQRAIAVWRGLAADYPTWPPYQEGAGHQLRLAGLAYLDAGKAEEARQTHTQAVAIWEALATNFPEHAYYRGEVGDEQGRAAKALAAQKKYAEARDLLEQAVKNLRPGPLAQTTYVAHFRNRVGECYEQLIEAHVRLTQIDAAVRTAQEFAAVASPTLDDRCTVAKRLIELIEKSRAWTTVAAERTALTQGLFDAARTGLQRAAEFKAARDRAGLAKLAEAFRADLAVPLQSQGLHTQSIQARRNAIQLLERLSSEHPADASYRQDLARSHQGEAISLRALGRNEDAERAYRKAIEIVEKLIADFSTEAKYAQEIGYMYTNLAILLAGQQRDAESEEFDKKALAVREKLAAKFPAEDKYQDALAGSLASAAARLRKEGSTAEAEKLYRRALAIQARLAEKHPTVAGYRRDLGYGHNNLGLFFQAVGRVPDAEEPFRAALALREKLAADFPNRPEYREELGFTSSNLAANYFNRDRMPDAEKYLRQAIATHERLTADYPDVPGFRRNLAYARFNLAYWHRRGGQFAEAESTIKEAQVAFDKLAEEFPENELYRKDTVYIRLQTARTLALSNRAAEADKMYRAILDKNPDSVAARAAYSWFLSTTPYTEFRNPAKALEMSKKLATEEPKVAERWNGLGVAEYRNGNWAAARTALEQAIKFRGSPHAADSFFLALTYWKLGDKQKAGQAFDEGVAWMDSNQPRDEDLLRFRAETADALGRPAKPK